MLSASLLDGRVKPGHGDVWDGLPDYALMLPASDPPSFSSGSIGAPEARKTKQPTGKSVKEAEQKVKTGGAKVPDTY